MDKREALRNLERAFRTWYWTTDQPMPDIGIVVIGLSRDGADIQYLGEDPNATVDWPAFFERVLEELVARRYSIDPHAGVIFPSQR